MPELVVCPKCGAINQPKDSKCVSCGYALVPAGLEFLLDVQGLSAALIQRLYLAGFKSADDLRKASAKEIAKVEGISRGMAERIKQHILKLELTGEEKKVALYICSHCGALLSEKATKCPQCGALVVQEPESEVQIETKTTEEEEKILKELEKPKVSLFLCSNCGAFVSSDAKNCPNCGALMETDVGEAKEVEETAEPEIKVQEMDGAIIGICSSCGAFLSKNATVCPVCGSPVENPISVAINSIGENARPGTETPIKTEYAISSFDPKLETEGKIFLCEVCGAFVSQDAKVCPICNSPTEKMKKEVLSIGGPGEMGKEEVLSLLEKEITSALDTAQKLESKKVEETAEESQETQIEHQEILDIPDFELVESEMKSVIPEHVAEEKPEGAEAGEQAEVVEHLADVHSSVTAELGDLLVENVVREKFSFEESEEKVEHCADPIGEVESELWEYFFEEEGETIEPGTECPICGYKNSPDAEKCEICGSIIAPEEESEGLGEEKEARPEKVKKLVVVEAQKPQPEFKEVKEVRLEAKPVPSTRVVPKVVVKEKQKANFIERNYYPILALSLISIGVLSLLIFGISLLALGAIGIGFLGAGLVFSYLILRKQKGKEEKVLRLPAPQKPSEIALFNMGSTYLATGRFEEAVKAFEEVVKLNPENEVAWNNLGSGLSKLERHEEALKCYEKALALKPDFEIAWNNRGNALARLGRFEEALKCYDKAIELKRDYHDAWVNKGYVLVKMGKYSEAIACANEANRLMERNYA